MELYETGNANIWSNPYTREQLLSAHLNQNSDAASRRPQTIKATVEWILQDYQSPGSLIDLGCGPGFYSQEFSGHGWEVLGIDINKSSLDYAIRENKSRGLSARYLEKSYLGKIDEGPFDLATCIYCDFGALTFDQQKTFLQNVQRVLTPNGNLVFDVFGVGISKTKTEGRSWIRENANGFWSESPCYVLSECQHFENEQVWGQKYIVIPDSGKPLTYILWDHYFTVNQIESLLANYGFEVTDTNTEIVKKNNFASEDVLFVRAMKIHQSIAPDHGKICRFPRKL